MILRKYILLSLITISCLSALQFSYSGLQQDDYYHIRSAWMLRQHGVYKEFPWAKHTILNRYYYDWHFLYHVLLIPFTFGNLIIGGKAASIIFATGVALFLYWFLNKYQVENAFFWSLMFIFGSSSFLTRVLAVRPISIAAGFFILGIHLLMSRKYVWIILLSYFFTLTYAAFPIYLVIVTVYTLTYLVQYKKLELMPILYCLTGIAAGLLLNPYFPNNLKVLYVTNIKRPFITTDVGFNLEWLPLSSWALFLSAWAIFILLFTALLFTLRKKGSPSFYSIFLFTVCKIFLLAYFKYARSVDQFVPLAVLFCAFVFVDFDIRPTALKRLVWVGIAFAVIGVNGYITQKDLRPLDRIDNSGSALWLEKNTRHGSEVFLTNYGAFPQLFFYNQHNYYTLGLDPIFMKEYDSNLFTHYRDAVFLRKEPYPIIKDMFGASYVHVENTPENRGFYGYLKSAPHRFRKVYQDDFSAVYEVR